ncbi:30S ribosomal protein S6 [Sulfurospirillum sp. 1612]|uniref:30S ribosomal protein S6 n=1 Tax=Sulfurospirillum sp. 1612 TaxID=3094835 RepID=UPI002F931CEC
MRHYELLTVLKPTLTEEELQAKINFVREVLEKNGAQIAALQDMKVRRLAYPIEKHDRGYYSVFYFTAPTTAIIEVERIIRITEEFIRFMSVKYENQKELAYWNKQVAKFTPKAVEEPAAEPATEAPVATPEQETVKETVED